MAAATSLAEAPIVRHVRRWPRRVLVTVVAILVLLVAVRIALPFAIERLVNQRLAAIPSYSGAVQDIDIHLFRGAYSLEGLAIFKDDGTMRQPFFSAADIDFSIAWRDLWRGKIVSDIHVQKGELVFVQGPTADATSTGADQPWQAVIEDLFPIDITHFELRDGSIRYIDATTEPRVDVFITNMRAIATGLRNRPDEAGEELPAEVTIAGDSLGGGEVHLQLAAEPLAAQPHFELSLKVDDVNLPALNEFLKAYANVDVSRGTFQLAAEMAGRHGAFQGYVKPFFNDLDFSDVEGDDKNIGERIWERIVAGFAWLVKNKSRDQVATRVPFQGRFGDPDVGLWPTIANLFRHGFVQAFNPTVEGTVEAEDVLPDGSHARGVDIADVKTPGPPDESQSEGDAKNRAGAPTGRGAETEK